MIVGVPTETKPDEYRVAITPIGVRELSEHGHDVLIQRGAGEGSAISDADYEAQGARIVPDAEAVFGEAEMVLKVKEPQTPEVGMLREGQTLFTYLHLAPAPELTRGLAESGATCVAYETVEDRLGRLPLLALQDDDALRLYSDGLLEPIEHTEGEYGGELLRSLEAFIENNGNWERAARQLYCHRHTLRYRIRKIEELTGRDLARATDRIELWLALRARELVR